ncbi:unnamed protein product [Acanthoscelides obtectus]|uniref:Uncharacterized protein n=1 Tax=Acanthoscelides obtectus TaxID=200917 RepID=A0A9P0PTY8_ACAOB|nr:unnamed protein product [Acanthoscelides obtectus]CAK1654438.1 hypothetical protein AOBTE_LOCUS18594 [Acanthoscelides obtectus]
MTCKAHCRQVNMVLPKYFWVIFGILTDYNTENSRPPGTSSPNPNTGGTPKTKRARTCYTSTSTTGEVIPCQKVSEPTKPQPNRTILEPERTSNRSPVPKSQDDIQEGTEAESVISYSDICFIHSSSQEFS